MVSINTAAKLHAVQGLTRRLVELIQECIEGEYRYEAMRSLSEAIHERVQELYDRG